MAAKICTKNMLAEIFCIFVTNFSIFFLDNFGISYAHYTFVRSIFENFDWNIENHQGQ